MRNKEGKHTHTHTHTHTKEWVSSEESRLSLSLSLELSSISRAVAQIVVVVPYKRERRCAQGKTSTDGLFLPGAEERGRRVDCWNEGWKGREGGIGLLKWGLEGEGGGRWAVEMRCGRGGRGELGCWNEGWNGLGQAIGLLKWGVGWIFNLSTFWSLVAFICFVGTKIKNPFFPLNFIGTYLFYLCKYLLLSTYLPTYLSSIFLQTIFLSIFLS